MKSLILSLVLMATTTANAGMLVEPYIGLEKGKTAMDAGVLGSADHDTSGAVLGARLGYTLPALFWFGLDYMLTTGGKGAAKNGIGAVDYDFTRSDLYVVAGFNFPILVRAWLGYGVMNEMKTDTSGTSSKLDGGTHTKLGVGFTGLPFVSINLEMYNHAPEKVDGNSFAAGSSLKDAGFLLTASLPLNL